MVAKITWPLSIKRTLNYNEQKVGRGEAELLHAEGFLKDVAHLSFKDKLQRFEGLMQLNERAKVKVLHVSLNFDKRDPLNKEKLVEIGSEYLKRIGFDGQPFLLYEHRDAGHPHVHLVSTTIKKDGTRIKTHNIAKERSEPVRKALQKEYGLVVAESRKLELDFALKPIAAKKVLHHKGSIKKAIQHVLDYTISQYKFSSLSELNAVLNGYNVQVNQGRGLSYQIISPEGKKLGPPISASLFYSKPTLKNLELKFKENEEKKQGLQLRIRNAIDLALLKEKTLSELLQDLQKVGISAVLRRTDEGRLYGVSFIDHTTKAVFKGSDLGKNYSASKLEQRCKKEEGMGLNKASSNEQSIVLTQKGDNRVSVPYKESSKTQGEEHSLPQKTVLEQLLEAETKDLHQASSLLPKRKKKKNHLGRRL